MRTRLSEDGECGVTERRFSVFHEQQHGIIAFYGRGAGREGSKEVGWRPEANAYQSVEKVDSCSLFKKLAGKAREKFKPEAYLPYVRV